MNIKNKLHYLISGQIPDFVRAEYPQFVTFLEHYYKFLEQNNQVNNRFLNSTDWNDIDLTLDIFIPYFRAQYAYDIPSDSLVTNRRLLKYINQYYEGKGSETSTEIFFRVMFNDTASVRYPGDYILRASDGRWLRKKYIKVETSLFDEDIFELDGQEINLRYLEFISGAGNIERTVTTRCFAVYETARPGIYQLEVDINPDYVFPDFISVDLSLAPSLGKEDTHVYIQKNGTTYGTITKQLVSINRITIEGSRFFRDDSYFISEAGIEGPYFASDYSESLGTAFGYAFESIQNNAVVRVSKTASTLLEPYFAEAYTELGDYASAPIRGRLTQMKIVDTGERFFARDDNDDPVNTFTITFNPLRTGGSPATVIFNTGLIYHAPGEYKDNAGFVSDIVYLQDNDYYQPYSYVVQTSIPSSSWRETYLNSSHPAGFKLFSELLLTDTITETFTIEDSLNQNVYYKDLPDETITVAESKVIEFSTSKTDSITVAESKVIEFSSVESDSISVAESSVKDIDKIESDVISVAEAPEISFDKITSESITVSDTATANLVFLRTFSDSLTINETDVILVDKVASDSLNVSENNVLSFNKVSSDNVTVSESGATFDVSLAATDSISVSESLSYNFDQQDDLTSDLQEDVNVSESAAIQFNKVTSDNVTVADSLVYAFDQQDDATSDLTDSISIDDTQKVFDFSKNVSDSISVSESLAYNFDQQDDATSDLTDSVSVSDTLTISFAKAASDVIDVIDAGVSFNKNKNVSDTITTNDQLRYTFNQNNDATSDLKEELTVGDTLTYVMDWNKAYSDALTVSENAVPILVIPVDLVDSITIDTTDTVINTNKSLTDSASTADEGGTIFTENYVENPSGTASGYFDEYYVGTLTSF